MRSLLLVVALVFSLSARAQTPRDPKVLKNAEKHFKPETKRDDFTKSVTTNLDLEELEGFRDKAMECGTAFVRLAILHDEDPKTGAITFLTFRYSADDWMFIQKGAPMQVLAGDSIRSFPSLSDPGRDASYGMAHEDQQFTLTSADLSWLAEQPILRARVEGEKGRCDFPIKPEALALIGLFNDRVVNAHTPTAQTR